jgi:hypothetical protein
MQWQRTQIPLVGVRWGNLGSAATEYEGNSMEPVTFIFTPTKEDYIRAIRAYYLHQWYIRVFWAISILQAGYWIVRLLSRVYIAMSDPVQLSSISIRAPVLGLALLTNIPILIFVIPRIQAGQMSKHERTLGEQKWMMDDERIYVQSWLSESKVDWGTFRRMIDTKLYYLTLYTVNRNLFHIIPKRAFESPEHEAAFRALVERHLGPIKK